MSTILLIEPDRIMAGLYFNALTEAGHEVIYAPSAQTGILVADDVQPDLIILEIQLVEHSGIEFLYELRSYADWQAVPVIINSIVPPSEFQTSYELLSNELGVSAYLYKPNTKVAELLRVISKVNLSKV
ncbi:MAG TPA: response regulator [Candidatus Saccharimonadales bacterium]|nr:response regulator [Candidatus Saccharimonadales bacterium]